MSDTQPTCIICFEYDFDCKCDKDLRKQVKNTFNKGEQNGSENQ